MKSIITILLTLTLFASTLSAQPENATKDDIKLLIHQMDKRFEQVDKHFEQVDKRFEQVDKRFDAMQNNMDHQFQYVFYILAAMFGFMIWDRRTMINTAKKETIKELEPQLIKKADKNILNEVVSVIEEMAKNDPIMQEILKKHHFKIGKN